MFKVLWKMLFPDHAHHYPTVRYAFPVVLAATLFAGLASVVSENSSYITITTDATTVSRDEQFTVDVDVTAHVPINAIDLRISYPKNRLVIDSIDTGTSVITLWTEEPHAKDGTIFLRGGTFRKGFIGEHPIARIKAHATEAGEARLLVEDTEFIAGDGRGTEVRASETIENSVKIMVQGSDGFIEAKAKLSVITDTDGDGDVDLRDVGIFMTAWFGGGRTYDFNGDGKMTIRDFSILLAASFFQ